MRRLIVLFGCVLLIVGVFFAFNNYTVPEPRFRANRTANLTLTTSWQTVDFNGTSSFNVNTFATIDGAGTRMVSWDSTNKLLKFNGDYDRNYAISFFVTTSTNLITTRSILQVRFVVPNGVSPGVDLIFPFPDDATPLVDMGEVTLLAGGVRHIPLNLDLYSNAAIRTNGVRVEVRLSNSLITLGVSNMTSASILIQD